VLTFCSASKDAERSSNRCESWCNAPRSSASRLGKLYSPAGHPLRMKVSNVPAEAGTSELALRILAWLTDFYANSVLANSLQMCGPMEER
jgi:hypothetical protein